MAKQAIEHAYGLPAGTLDQAEATLNQAGTDPQRRAAAKGKLRGQGIPADVVDALDERTRRVSWWEKLLAAVGL